LRIASAGERRDWIRGVDVLRWTGWPTTKEQPMTSSTSSRSAVRPAAVLAAVVGACVGWLIADPVGGIELRVTIDGEPTMVGPLDAGGVALAAGLAAWGALALIERAGERVRRRWTTLALTILALSFAGPLTAAETTGATLALLVLHLLVGAILILTLRSTIRS
jgi:hypothetical protein